MERNYPCRKAVAASNKGRMTESRPKRDKFKVMEGGSLRGFHAYYQSEHKNN